MQWSLLHTYNYIYLLLIIVRSYGLLKFHCLTPNLKLYFFLLSKWCDKAQGRHDLVNTADDVQLI